MHFVPLAFSDSCNLPDCSAQAGDSAPNRFYSYGVIARLALLAAAIELEVTASKLLDVPAPSAALAAAIAGEHFVSLLEVRRKTHGVNVAFYRRSAR
jgi:hypothetical protein